MKKLWLFIGRMNPPHKWHIAVIEKAVRGMLPKSKLGRAMFKKLYVYEGSNHPHVAQKPEPFKFQ